MLGIISGHSESSAVSKDLTEEIMSAVRIHELAMMQLMEKIITEFTILEKRVSKLESNEFN